MTAPQALPGTIRRLRDSWELSLRAANKRPRTIEGYLETLRFFEEFLVENGLPTQADAITRQHIEAWIAHLIDTRSASTAKTRFASLKPFFNWAADDGEIERSPMERIRPPYAPKNPTKHLSEDEVKAILRACAGRDFQRTRDTAIIRLYIDNGSRRSEIANLRVDEIDLADRTARVLVKGGFVRTIPFGNKTAEALDRYLRQRDRHRHADLPNLWLSPKGRFTSDGVRQMLERIGREAGVENLHAHRFRPTFAHMYQQNGASEGATMAAAGWRSRAMLDHYGTSSAEERSRETHSRLSPGDRL